MSGGAMDRRPVIVGAYEGVPTPSGASCLSLSVEGALGALRDAGLRTSDVDAVLVAHAWEEPTLMESVLLAEQLGIEPRYTETVCLGGASPCAMVARAAAAIELGLCDVAVLAAGSNRATGLGRQKAIEALRDVAHPEFEVPFGAYIPALYALAAQRHMHAYGTTPEQLASVAVIQRENAAAKPGAAKTSPITVEDVLSSRIVASPLHVLDCCLVTDFSAGLVLTTAARAHDLSATAVYVAGFGEAHGPLSLVHNPMVERLPAARRASEEAFTRAGVTPDAVDVAQLYDSFTITVLLTLEALGLCPEGESGRFVETGATRPDGVLPMNTNGGMLSFATGGMFHVTEAVAQLRGTAAVKPPTKPSIGLVHGIGGILSSHVTLILTTIDAT